MELQSGEVENSNLYIENWNFKNYKQNVDTGIVKSGLIDLKSFGGLIDIFNSEFYEIES